MELMKKNLTYLAGLTTVLLFCSCASHYRLAGVERSRILIDNRYDTQLPMEPTAFLVPYKAQVDSIMAPVVGHAARFLAAEAPESPLSNLLSDILMWAGKAYDEQPDFSVYNIGGMRAAFAQGAVTVGDVLDVAPFENKICFLTLKGEMVTELFRQIAASGGEGVSGTVRLRITKENRLVEATVNGEPIDPQRTYRVVTLDYVAQGNDGMAAFKNGTDIHSPKDEHNNVRFIIMDYFREKMAQGQEVDAQKDGRITVE